MARACRDFHIRRSLKISAACVHDEAPSPLSRDSMHVAMSFARAIMFYMIRSSSRHEEKVVDINNRVNAISQQYNERYFPRVLKTHFATYLSDRSQLDCARVRIRIFTGRGALNIPFRECESARRFYETMCVSAHMCIYVCVCGITQGFSRENSRYTNKLFIVCNSDAIFLTTHA